MDTEEHSVIMQQVKELEVRSEMASPQYAVARGGPHIWVVLGAVVPPGLCVQALGYGMPRAVLGELLRSRLLT